MAGAVSSLRWSGPADQGYAAEAAHSAPAAERFVSQTPATRDARGVPTGRRDVGAAPHEPARTRPEPGPPVRLELPRLAVSASVVPVGVGAGGALDVPEDPQVLGWWSSGARPGQGWGAVVIDGHVDSATRGLGTFARLRDLETGDPVLTVTASGEVRRYRVSGRQQFAKATLPAAEVFSQDGAERLVLITCGGRFDRSRGRYDDNLVVFAVPEAQDTVQEAVEPAAGQAG